MEVKVQKLHPAAVIPSQAHPGDAGWDLVTPEEFTLQPGERKTIGLGFAVAFESGHVALIRDRSGLGSKGLHTLAGVIDASYRGEWKIVFLNTSSEPMSLKVGERVAQCLFLPIAGVEMSETKNLEETSRGSGGFGSTGQ
ncbi:MAG: dUTP diphosphatase [Candidatus Kerfeldbacteria bacterium]|nr:dUTP diphosphatase [Candidatus Kerfeldbacteria bacterium]